MKTNIYFVGSYTSEICETFVITMIFGGHPGSLDILTFEFNFV